VFALGDLATKLSTNHFVGDRTSQAHVVFDQQDGGHRASRNAADQAASSASLVVIEPPAAGLIKQ